MSSMYTVNGKVVNAFSEWMPPRGDQEGRRVHRVQIMGEVPTRDGEGSRYDLDTLTVPDSETYRSLIGKSIRLPVGLFSPAKGQVIKFVPKGTAPEVLER